MNYKWLFLSLMLIAIAIGLFVWPDKQKGIIDDGFSQNSSLDKIYSGDELESEGAVSIKPIHYSSNNLSTVRVDDDYTQAGTLVEALEKTALANNWSKKDYVSNASLWREACQSVNKVPVDRSSSDLAKIDFRYAQRRSMLEICEEFALDHEIDVLDALDNALESGLGIGEAPYNPNREDRNSALQSGDSEGAVGLAINQINVALERFDESGVLNPLFFLTQNELLNPPISDPEINSSPLYYNVFREVGATLICQKLQGCSSEEHPFVIRQCLNGLKIRGAACYKPLNIQDAIYQTLTPLEYQAYGVMLNQVNALLRQNT